MKTRRHERYTMACFVVL